MSKRPSNSVKDRLSRWDMNKRRLRRFVRPGAWILFAVLVLSLGTAIVRSADPGGTALSFRERLGGATGFAGLRITEVVIQGRANTPEPLLRAALGVNKGDPILGFSVEQARKRIEELSWVEQATVERRLPNTVVVFLQERRPFAVWQNQGKFVLIDRAGQVVDNQDVAHFRHLPLVVGAVGWKPIIVDLSSLNGCAFDEAKIRAAVQQVRDLAQPLSNVRGSAMYKRNMAVEIGARTLIRAWQRAAQQK